MVVAIQGTKSPSYPSVLLDAGPQKARIPDYGEFIACRKPFDGLLIRVRAFVVGDKVTVILGVAGARKRNALIDRYHLASAGGGVRKARNTGSRLWIAPTERAAAAIRLALAEKEPASLAPNVATFYRLARQVVLASGHPVHVIPSALQRELLRRTIEVAREKELLESLRGAAEQRGFIDLLANHFTELRQRGISPQVYQQVVRAGRLQERVEQHELARLFVSYDELLRTHNLCDAAGLTSHATDVLSSTQCGLFRELSLLTVDGFTDFTRAEFSLLLRLASHAKEVAVSLTFDARPSRRHLFAKTAATLTELKAHFPTVDEIVLPPRPKKNAALAFISQQIFRYPHDKPPPEVLSDLPNVEIVAAASAHDEIIQIARRIKRLLTGLTREVTGDCGQRARPSDILVVVRSFADIAPRIEEVFRRYGIPHSLETSARIERSPAYRAIRSLLQLDAEDWPFRQLVAVIANRLIGAINEAERRAADWLIRDLQIASGRTALLDTITEFAAQNERQVELGDQQKRRVAAAVVALPALQRVANALDRLPQTATLIEWTTVLTKMAVELGILRPVELVDGKLAVDERLSAGVWNNAVWHVLTSHLQSLEQLDRWLGEPPRVRSRRELLALLADIAAKEALPRSHDEVGRVRVLSAQSARTESVPHLFFAGMSEQAFPAGPSSGRLANDNDYRQLTSAAHQKQKAAKRDKVAAIESSTHSQDEMLLFYEVISRAQETLTISYPAMDDKAQELPPSPFVIEVQRIFRGSDRQIQCAKPQLSPVPHVAASLQDADSRTIHDIFSAADWRLAATAAAATTEGDRRLLAGFIADDATRAVGQAMDAGIRVVYARARGESFGPFEGVLVNPAITKRLGDRFGKRHTWSPSQFETYAACPYKFFLEIVLGLEPLGDLTLETDFARRGSLLHQVLAAFHRKYSGSPSEWSALWQNDQRFSAELKHALGAAFAGVPQEGIDAALLELDRRQIDKWTDDYQNQHGNYDKAWSTLDEPPRPTHFELRFGRKHSGEEGYEDPNSVDNAFQLNIGGETIHVAGRIDRIDVGRAGGQTVFNVIDYKSGRRPTLTSEKIESGERLQPALYVMAAQALVFGDQQATPLWAGYWSLKNGVTTRKDYSLHCSLETGKLTDEWQQLKPKVIARIADIVRSARRGDFPINSIDANCTSFCDFKTVCRVGQVRSIGKIWTPLADDA